MVKGCGNYDKQEQIQLKKAVIIGAGIAGLASALRLRKKGFEVKVLEANTYAGGKIHAFQEKGYRFDAGPSLFTMPHLVDELFELFSLNPPDFFRYQQKEIVCNYFWEDDTSFSAKADRFKFVQDAANTFNEDPGKIERYLAKNALKFDLTKEVFLEKSLHKLSTYLSYNTLSSFLQAYKLDLFSSLNTVNERAFKNDKLVQLFNRYATYNGSSPYKTPGIMSMIPHLEMDGGTYFPEGGMHRISQSLYELAKEQGVVFHFEEPAKEIMLEGKTVTGVKTEENLYQADVVVSNADVYATYHNLLPTVKKPQKVLRQERSSSALIFYWGINRTFKELDLHNILFSADYQKEFDTIFDKHSVDTDPTIYINITSKEAPSDAPSGCENWFVMVNTPPNYGQDWASLEMETRKNVIAKINRMLKTKIEEHIEMEEILDPVKIEDRTSSFRGSLYGTSSNSQFAAFLRHSNFAPNLRNLYFCGGSTHPGGGIPLCLLSARIMAEGID